MIVLRQASTDFSEGKDPYLDWALDLKARGLAFETKDDALNLADVLVQKSRNYLSGHNLTAGERYVAGSAVIKIQLRPEGHASDFPLILVAATDKSSPLAAPKALDNMDIVGSGMDLDVHAEHDLMLVWAGNPAKCPQKVVPSKVWLERLHIGDDVRVNAEALCLDDIIDVPYILANREVYLFDGARVQNGAACMDGLVKSVPQVVQGVGGGGSDVPWDLTFEANFVDILSRLKIRFSEWECSAYIEEGLPLGCEVGIVFFSPVN